MDQNIIVIAALAAGTFAIRLGGYLLGASLPVTGGWARGLQALPGCLIVALLAMILAQSGPAEWLAALLALTIALISKSLPLTMLAGVGAVWMLRLVF